MKHISALRDLGTGRRALLIGNGHSVNEFDFESINLNDYFIFGINRLQQPVRPDYVIYYDKPSKEQLQDFSRKGETEIIGFELNECAYTDYFYNNNDIIFCDSGSHLLQLVSNLMGFSIIYLIGYDYKMTDTIRYFDTENTQNEINLYEKTIFQRALHRYYKPECTCSDKTLYNLIRDEKGIYNCKCEEKDIFKCKHIFNLNRESALKKFPHKILKEEVCQM